MQERSEKSWITLDTSKTIINIKLPDCLYLVCTEYVKEFPKLSDKLLTCNNNII